MIIECFAVGLERTGEVQRMNPLGPSITELLLERTSGEIEPGPIEVIALLVRARAPYRTRKIIEHVGMKVLRAIDCAWQLAGNRLWIQLRFLFCLVRHDCNPKSTHKIKIDHRRHDESTGRGMRLSRVTRRVLGEGRGPIGSKARRGNRDQSARASIGIMNCMCVETFMQPVRARMVS